MHINNFSNANRVKDIKSANSSAKTFSLKKAATTSNISDIMNVSNNAYTNNDIRFMLESAYIKEQSDIVFEYLNQLKIQIISQELDLESIIKLREQLLKNKKKFMYKDLENLLDDVIMRLEIEIAKLDHLTPIQA